MLISLNLADKTASSVFYSLLRLVCTHKANKRTRMLLRCAKRTRFPPSPSPDTGGKSFTLRSCVDITGKTISLRRASSGSITCMGPWALTMGGRRRLRRRSAERLRWSKTEVKLRYGVTGSKRDPSCTYTTVSKDWSASWPPITVMPLT